MVRQVLDCVSTDAQKDKVPDVHTSLRTDFDTDESIVMRSGFCLDRGFVIRLDHGHHPCVRRADARSPNWKSSVGYIGADRDPFVSLLLGQGQGTSVDTAGQQRNHISWLCIIDGGLKVVAVCDNTYDTRSPSARQLHLRPRQLRWAAGRTIVVKRIR